MLHIPSQFDYFVMEKASIRNTQNIKMKFKWNHLHANDVSVKLFLLTRGDIYLQINTEWELSISPSISHLI